MCGTPIIVPYKQKAFSHLMFIIKKKNITLSSTGTLRGWLQHRIIAFLNFANIQKWLQVDPRDDFWSKSLWEAMGQFLDPETILQNPEQFLPKISIIAHL